MIIQYNMRHGLSGHAAVFMFRSWIARRNFYLVNMGTAVGKCIAVPIYDIGEENECNESQLLLIGRNVCKEDFD